MNTYDVTATCRADASRVYELLVDGSSWPTWSAIDSYDVERTGGDAPALDGEPSALVAQGRALRVFRTGRNVSRERIVELVPDRRLVYEMLSGGSGMFKGYRGRIDLEPEPGGGTRIRWRASWKTPVPGVGWFTQWYLRRFQQDMVNGLARFADHGPSGTGTG